MKTLIIGVGAAGNKAAISIIGRAKDIEAEDVVLINSTNKDIPKDWDGATILLSPENFGCGKERSIAKELTLTAIQNGVMDNALAGKSELYDIAVIITSVEGGTGSGASPIIAKYCSQMLGKNTHLIAFTGFEADVRGLQNTVEFFQEVDSTIMVQAISNKSFLRAAGGVELKAETMANLEVAKRVQIINGSLLMDSDHNIDSTDIYKAVNTAGYTTVEYAEVKDTLMDTADFEKICKNMIYNSKSLKSDDPGQNRMAVIMNLEPASQDAIDFSFKMLKETYGVPFECFMHKQFDEDMPQFIAYICSGMKMPLGEVKAVFERYKEQSSRVNRDTDSFFSEVNTLRGNTDDSRFDMGRPTSRSTVSKEDFMSQFTTSKPQKEKEITIMGSSKKRG